MKKLLCFLGFHKWYRSVTTFGNPAEIKPDSPRIVSRNCTRCYKAQTLKDKWIDTEKLSKQLTK